MKTIDLSRPAREQEGHRMNPIDLRSAEVEGEGDSVHSMVGPLSDSWRVDHPMKSRDVGPSEAEEEARSMNSIDAWFQTCGGRRNRTKRCWRPAVSRPTPGGLQVWRWRVAHFLMPPEQSRRKTMKIVAEKPEPGQPGQTLHRRTHFAKPYGDDDSAQAQ
jgi:hypothetical protein